MTMEHLYRTGQKTLAFIVDASTASKFVKNKNVHLHHRPTVYQKRKLANAVLFTLAKLQPTFRQIRTVMNMDRIIYRKNLQSGKVLSLYKKTHQHLPCKYLIETPMKFCPKIKIYLEEIALRKISR